MQILDTTDITTTIELFPDTYSDSDIYISWMNFLNVTSYSLLLKMEIKW